MNETVKVGDRISGYCNGYFGRDDYESKICVMVTNRYAVFEYLDKTDYENIGAVILTSSPIKDEYTEWKAEYEVN